MRDAPLLVNGVPATSAKASATAKGYRMRFAARCDVRSFDALAQRFPSFGVRRCGYEVRLSAQDMEALQKYLTIYSDVAGELQAAGGLLP